MHTRLVKISLASGPGTEAGTIGVSPKRYAGMYLRFTPDTLTATVVAKNMGRTLSGPDAGAADKHLDELLPTAEKLVNGEVVVEASGASGPGTLEALLFFHDS